MKKLPLAALCACFLTLLTALTARAQTVDAFDPNVGGSTVYAIAVQGDGKVVFGGQFTTVGGQARQNLARVKPDGTLDTAFTQYTDGNVNDLGLQSDGKILVGGSFRKVGGETRDWLARLNPDGTLDTAFAPISNGWPQTIMVQPDDKVLIGGYFTTAGWQWRSNIARLNSDGTLDTAFDPGANNTPRDFALQPDGKIIVVGDFTTIGGAARNFVARLNTDGTLDTTFTSPFSTDNGNRALQVVLQRDGKVVVGGFFTNSGQPTRRLARLNSDGTIDATFNMSPEVAALSVESLALHTDGQVLVGADRITRLNGDGTADHFLNVNVSGGVVTALTVQGDGKVIAGGMFTHVGGQARNRVARVTPPPALQPVADAYVRGATPDGNYGTAAELQVKRTFTPGNGKGRQAYLRFDTTSVEGAITKATLRVYGRLSAATGTNVNIPLAIFPVSAAWGELTLTWNNKPAPDVPAELARVTVTDATARWYEFDVTNFINQERTAGRMVTGVLLRNMQRGEVGDYFTAVNSREAASNQPQLVIEQ